LKSQPTGWRALKRTSQTGNPLSKITKLAVEIGTRHGVQLCVDKWVLNESLTSTEASQFIKKTWGSLEKFETLLSKLDAQLVGFKGKFRKEMDAAGQSLSRICPDVHVPAIKKDETWESAILFGCIEILLFELAESNIELTFGGNLLDADVSKLRNVISTKKAPKVFLELLAIQSKLNEGAFYKGVPVSVERFLDTVAGVAGWIYPCKKS
jgi:hypothetical protein